MTRVGPAGAPRRTAEGKTEKAWTKDRQKVTARPGIRSGRKIVRKRAEARAPRVAAACSRAGSMPVT